MAKLAGTGALFRATYAKLGVAVGVSLAGAIWALPVLDQWRRSLITDQLARHAEALSGGAAQLEVRQLAEWELDALDALARLAGSANSDAAEAARARVASQLAAWETAFRNDDRAGEFAHKLAAVATALAKYAAEYDGSTRNWSNRLALEIVHCCDRLTAADAMPVLAQCDRALSAPVRAKPATPDIRKTAKPSAEVAAAPWSRFEGVAPRAESVRTAPPLASASGENDEASAPPAAAPGDLASKSNGDLRVIETPVESALGEPVLNEAAPADAPPQQAIESPRPRPLPLPAPAADPSLVDIPTPQQQRVLLRKFRLMSDRELATRLATASGFEALVLQQAMRERQRVATARGPNSRTTSSAPLAAPKRRETERALYDRVSKLPAENARTLLRELASDNDEDADTRLQALTLLATSGDPQLTELARRRALEDADPRVADLATRILREGQAK